MDKIDHSKGLCGIPDNKATFLSREDAEANPPKCKCCRHRMVVRDCTSEGLNQLGMYWLICEFCSAKKISNNNIVIESA